MVVRRPKLYQRTVAIFVVQFRRFVVWIRRIRTEKQLGSPNKKKGIPNHQQPVSHGYYCWSYGMGHCLFAHLHCEAKRDN